MQMTLHRCYINTFCLLVLCFFLGSTATLSAQTKKYRRYDSTLKLNKAGYHLYSNNKLDDNNEVTISPIGFDNGAREMSFIIKGRLVLAEVDDLNNDGFPDVVMYAKSSAPNEKGYLYAISSEENRSFRPIAFPDITDDAKLSKGYRGHDEFSLLETTLMRKFPIYSDTDSTNQGPIGKRVVQYRLVNKEGRLTFIVLRSYEAKQ